MKRKPDTNIPPKLQDIDFIIAWENWRDYRKTRGKFTPHTEELQLRACNDIGIERAIAMIEFSIKSGYQGLFEPGDARPREAETKFEPHKSRPNLEALQSIDLPETERQKLLSGLKAIKLTIR